MRVDGPNPLWLLCYIQDLPWEVEFTDEFEQWWHSLSESEQGKVDARVDLLMERGPNLGFPFSSQVKTSGWRNPTDAKDLKVRLGRSLFRAIFESVRAWRNRQTHRT